MDKTKLAEKLYQAHHRGRGIEGDRPMKAAAFKRLSRAEQRHWEAAAEIAIANVCKPEECVHMEVAIENAEKNRKVAFESTSRQDQPMNRLLIIVAMLASAALRRWMSCRRCIHWQRVKRDGRCLRGVNGVRWCSLWEWKGLRP